MPVVKWSSTGMKDNRRCDPLNKVSNTMASDQTANSNCPKQTCRPAAPHNTTRHSETAGTIYTSAVTGLISTSKTRDTDSQTTTQTTWFPEKTKIEAILLTSIISVSESFMVLQHHWATLLYKGQNSPYSTTLWLICLEKSPQLTHFAPLVSKKVLARTWAFYRDGEIMSSILMNTQIK